MSEDRNNVLLLWDNGYDAPKLYRLRDLDDELYREIVQLDGLYGNRDLPIELDPQFFRLQARLAKGSAAEERGCYEAALQPLVGQWHRHEVTTDRPRHYPGRWHFIRTGWAF